MTKRKGPPPLRPLPEAVQRVRDLVLDVIEDAQIDATADPKKALAYVRAESERALNELHHDVQRSEARNG